jgi:ribosomal protein L11
MKTFKLVSVQCVDHDKFIDIELADGLIINKEDENNTWLIEVLTNSSHQDFFEKAYQDQRDFIIRVVITKQENDPVSFHIKVCSLQKLENNISIMLKGTLKRNSRRNYAEVLLKELLDKGLNGEDILSEFKEQMKNKPYLAISEKITPFGKR